MNYEYKTHRTRTVVLLMTLATGLALMSGCDEWEPCRGFPEVYTLIPDVVLVENVESYVRDLEASPPVFDHSGGEWMFYDARSSDRSVADVWVSEDGILEVAANYPGITTVRVEAFDDCDEWVETFFEVEVVEATLAGKTATVRPYIMDKNRTTNLVIPSKKKRRK